METQTVLHKTKRKPKKTKEKGIAWYKKKSISEAKRVTRKKGKCERCGGTKNLQGSHIIPISSSTLIGADLDNILCLCMSCHLYWWHKHPLAASEWFNRTWPGRKAMLETRATQRRNNKPSLEFWKKLYASLKAL